MTLPTSLADSAQPSTPFEPIGPAVLRGQAEMPSVTSLSVGEVAVVLDTPEVVPGQVSIYVWRIVFGALTAASVLSCKEASNIWAEEPDYSGAPTQLCDAANEGAAQATFGKLFETEGPLLESLMGSPVLGDERCLVTCVFPHSFPDTDLQMGDRVRLRGRIRQYRGWGPAGRTTTYIELDPCAFVGLSR